MIEEEKGTKKAIMFTFTMKSSSVSNSEKTRFFKELYGWTQTVPGGKKKYVYHREGVLEDVPHEKVDQSSFLVPESEADEIMEFFEEWHKKVMLRTFKVLLDDDDDLFKDMRMIKKKIEMDEGDE
jgi:hypothetical protein